MPTNPYLLSLLHFVILLCNVSFLHAQKIDTTEAAWTEGQDKIEQNYQQGKIETVKTLVFYNLDRAEKKYSQQSEEYRLSIFYLARLYEAEGNFASAEKTYKKTAELYLKMGEENSLEYAILLREMGKLYQDNRRYPLADSLLNSATKIALNSEGKKHKEYAICLLYQANFYSEIGEYDNAVKSFEELGKKHLHKLEAFDYMSVLLDMGFTYELAGRYEDALNTYLRCQNYENKNSKDLSNNSTKGLLAIANNGLGRVYEQLGDYKNAKQHFFAANTYFSTNVEPSSKEYDNYRVLLEDFAAFYENIGDFKSAEEVYKKLSTTSKNPQQNALVQNNLGMLYEAMGNYPQAEIYYLSAKKNYEQVNQLRLDQHDYANNLTNLAGLYELIGRYKLSEKLYLQAKALDEITVGKSHPDYAATLNNIAKLYTSLKEYDKAEAYYLEAKKIIQHTVGSHHPHYVRTSSNQALLYQIMGRYAESEAIYENVLKLQQKMLGAKHPDYATTLNRMAGLYKLMDNTKESKKRYEQASKLRLELLGETHPDYAATLNEFAQLHHYLKNRDEALRLFRLSNHIIIEQIQKIYPILSESERLLFYSKQEPRLEAFYSFASDYLAEIPELAIELQNMNLLIKGLALETTVSVKSMALQNTNDTIRSMFNEWVGHCNRISQLYSKSLVQQSYAHQPLDSLVDAANELEALLCKSSTYFKNKRAQNKQQINLKVLCNQLTDDEAIIDFMGFHYHNGKNYTNEVRYFAFILHQNTEIPQWIRLVDEEQLKQLLNRKMALHSSNYATSERLSYLLYKRIWEPFEPFLENIKTVHICATGLLHKVSFAALMPDSSFLLEKYNLANYSNLRDFLHQKNDSLKLDSTHHAILIGNPAFSTAIPHLRNSNKEDLVALENRFDVPVNLINPENKSLQIGYFGPLEGTKNEVLKIQKLLDSLQCKVKRYTEKEAIEEHIKHCNTDDKPNILHIATHGYFFPSIEDEDSTSLQQSNLSQRLRYLSNPLWRSGLAFAGANFIWKGVAPPKDMEDGILMAYEVANLNLFGVNLVVLSACDTGRGDLHNSEGVLGIQRAFKTAGVQQLIISLWQVPDTETAELMTTFYQYLAKGMPIRKAFQAAQITMSKKYAPFYWAGFILIE
jgi:CHAT domain-containing protein